MIVDEIRSQVRVLRALVLRDMRTRFGGGFLSYAIAIVLPLIHLFLLLLIPLLFVQVTPLGTQYAIFAATGVLPYILCLYPSRMLMLCIQENRPLLAFPIVKPPDIIAARALLEIVVALSVTLLFLLLLALANYDVVPFDAANATYAILSTIMFGISFGYFSAVVQGMARAWLLVHITLMIGMYLTCGAFFLPRALPENLRIMISYNPLFHCVEWLRISYFEGYGDEMLSRSYLWGVNLILLLLGMAAERLMRGRLAMG